MTRAGAPEPSAPAAYHHGDLSMVLRPSAVAVIVDKGLHGFSLREVARRPDVSHAAPSCHFGDVSGLLTAVAIQGFETLHEDLVIAGAGIEDPILDGHVDRFPDLILSGLLDRRRRPKRARR